MRRAWEFGSVHFSTVLSKLYGCSQCKPSYDSAADSAANFTKHHNATFVIGCMQIDCTVAYLITLGVHDLIIFKELPPNVKEV